MRRGSFRQRQFLTMLALAVFSLVIITAVILPYSRNATVQQATALLETVADMKTIQVQQWLDQGCEVAQLVSKTDEIRENFPTLLASEDDEAKALAQVHLHGEIGSISAAFPNVQSVSLLHPTDGRVLLSTDPTQVGRERQGEDYFYNGQQALYVSPVVYSTSRQAPALTISAPARDEDSNLLAVVAVEMDLADLDAAVSSHTGLEQTSRVYLVETYGFYVTLPPDMEGHPLRTAARSEGVRRALEGQNGSDTYPDPRGVRVLGAYRWLPEVHLGLLVEIEETELTSQITRTWLLVILVILGLLAAGVVAARTLSNWLVSPVERITAAAHALRSGDLTHRAPPGGPDEIDQLSTAFNEMADNLQLQYRELQREATERQRAEEAEREQRALAEALRDTAEALSSTLDLDEVLDRILANVGQVVPSDAVNIHLLDENSEIGRIYRIHGYAESGLGAPALGKTYRLADVPTFRRMAESRQTFVVPDTQADPDWVVFPETRWVRSYASAPICLQDKVIGFLNLDSATPGFFTPAHAEQLQAFADQAATAIQNARMYSRLEEYSQALEAKVEERTRELREHIRLLSAAMEEKEALLKEIHHRVKNNLQVISALLGFQSDATADERVRVALQEGQNRIQSMASIHEQLYQSHDLAQIEMKNYIQDLATELRQSYGAHAVAVQVDVADVTMGIDAAIPCGLIINELLSNALKYAFPSAGNGISRKNEVRIALRPLHQNDTHELTVQDNGTGLSTDLQHVRTLGLRLVQMLTRQLEGTLDVDSAEGEGTTFRITFPAPT